MLFGITLRDSHEVVIVRYVYATPAASINQQAALAALPIRGPLSCTHDCFSRNFHTITDSVVCNGEKLVTGSTSAFVHASEEFLNSTVFPDGHPWPSAIMAPSNVVDRHTAPNLAIIVSIVFVYIGGRGRAHVTLSAY